MLNLNVSGTYVGFWVTNIELQACDSINWDASMYPNVTPYSQNFVAPIETAQIVFDKMTAYGHSKAINITGINHKEFFNSIVATCDEEESVSGSIAVNIAGSTELLWNTRDRWINYIGYAATV